MTTLEIIRLVADFVLVPLFWLVWDIQGRLSKIEGYIMRDKDHE